jgi:cbb3-type cytochrome oxidase maturation protein
MDISVYFIPVSILFGGILLWALIWSIRSGQYDDLEGAASRILYDEPTEDGHNKEMK